MTPEELRVVGELRVLAASGRARSMRVSQRIGLRELARAIKASPSAVSRWEHGQHSPRGSAALRWAMALGLLENAAEVQSAVHTKGGTALEVQSGATAAKNSDAAGVQPAASNEQSIPTAK